MSEGLSQQLRENCVYLREGGWRNAAMLMQFAADELDRLEARLRELDKTPGDRRSVKGLVARVALRRKPRRPRHGRA